MKTKLFVFFLAISLFTISCKKEIEQELDVTKPKQISDQELVKKVERFIQLAHNVKEGKILKSEDKMPIPDAIDFIDESFNYEYVFHTEPYGNILKETAEVILPIIVGEEKTYTVDAAAGYNEAVSQIRNKYGNIASTDKNLIGILVENKGLYNSSNIKILVTAIIGVGKPSIEDPNYSLDFWWSRDSHNCDQSLWEEGGAPNIIDARVKGAFMQAPPPNTRVWFTDEEPFDYEDPTDYLNNNDPNPGDNYCDYMLYYATEEYGTFTHDDLCLSGESENNEMDFYTASTINFIQSQIDSTQLSFSLVNTTSWPGTDNNYNTKYHSLFFTLGIRHTTSWASQYPICID